MSSSKSQTTLLIMPKGKVDVGKLEIDLREIQILAIDYQSYKRRNYFFERDGVRRKN